MTSIRRLIRGFYKLVHPDLLVGSAQEAIECNARSLQEMNAYIDRLESTESVPAPFVARILQFFKPPINRNGEILHGSLRICQVNLSSIPPSADILDKEEISVRLIRDIEKLLEYQPMFSSKLEEQELIEPILARPSKSETVRSELDKIWEREALVQEMKSSIFGSIDDHLSQRREYSSIIIYNKLVRKYSKIKNKKKREGKLENLEAEVKLKLDENPQWSSLDFLDTRDNANDREKIKVIEAGFHPDLVFFEPSLTDFEREEGISRVCGVNLSADSDLWLLENIWKAVRLDKQPAVPIVLGREFVSEDSSGYIRIPYNFILADLVDFLEMHL